MTKDQQIFAVAKLRGYNTERQVLGSCFVYYDPLGRLLARLPQYPGDLNAIAEAVLSLSTKEFRGADGSMHTQQGDFNMHLERIIQRDTGTCLQFDVINASAAQRCEAYLATLGKLEE